MTKSIEANANILASIIEAKEALTTHEYAACMSLFIYLLENDSNGVNGVLFSEYGEKVEFWIDLIIGIAQERENLKQTEIDTEKNKK